MNKQTIEQAAARLEPHVVRTPVLRCPKLDELAGTRLWLKAENLQHIGAFKTRGAMNAIMQLTDAQRARGVITYSSGNHAQAVALAAMRLHIRADIAMPDNAPAIKIDAVRRLGAHVVFAGTTSPDRRDCAHALATERGGIIIEPFDHAHIIAGAGTATLELLQEAPALDALLIPVGGGGLIAGACLAAEATKTNVYSVEPVGCDSMARSLASGALTSVDPGSTIADGLKPTCVGQLPFDIARQRVAGTFTVQDAELERALALLLIHAKVLVEPSGSAALAVALRGALPGSPQNVGVLLSGGNVDPERIADILQRH